MNHKIVNSKFKNNTSSNLNVGAMYGINDHIEEDGYIIMNDNIFEDNYG